MSLKMELGVIRQFGIADVGHDGLISGWAELEDGHNWNSGFESRLQLEVPRASSAVQIIVEGEPYITPRLKSQDITLYANGFYLAFWRLLFREQYTLAATVEPEQWIKRDGRSVLSLTWLMPNATAPVDIKEGVDGRHLSFAFRTLLLK